jgi:predicted ester cyclase
VIVSTSSLHTTRAYQVMRRIFDEGFAAGDESVVDELCSPSLVEHQFGLAAAGEQAREHVRAAIRDVHGAFPDIVFTIEDFVEQGDKIWVRVRARGTASGPFFGAPSNRPVDITVFDLARIVNGQIVEHWGVPDRFALLAQTGVLDRLAAPDALSGHELPAQLCPASSLPPTRTRVAAASAGAAGLARDVARIHASWRAIIRLTANGANRHRYHATRADDGAMTSAALRSIPRTMSLASRSGA